MRRVASPMDPQNLVPSIGGFGSSTLAGYSSASVVYPRLLPLIFRCLARTAVLCRHWVPLNRRRCCVLDRGGAGYVLLLVHVP